MRKLMAMVLFLGMACGTVFALTPAEEKEMKFQEMKKIKDAQRVERDAMKSGNASQAAEPTKMSRFWQKEGERSGLGNSRSRMGNFLGNLNPVPFFKEQQDRYEARKNQGSVK